MRAASVAGLVLASLTKLASAQDLLFYENMLYTEYDEATKVLGLTTHVANDAEWRSYTTADFAKYKAIIIPDPNCGTIDRIQFLEDTKAVWSPAVKGKMIIIGTDPTYHSASRVGATHLIDDAVKFAASDPDGETGLYFSLSCYYDSVDITTIDALSEFGNFYVRGKLACYNDAHLVATAAELDTVDDSKLGNWSCSVHEVFTEYPKTGVTPGSDGFEALAIALNATGDGEESYGDGTSGIPYIIARGATPLGCGNGKYEPEFGEECDDGTANGTPGNPCSEACKCLFGVASEGVCKLNTTSSSSSSMSSTSSVFSNSSTALPSTSANSTLAPSSVLPTSSVASSPAPSTSEPSSSAAPPMSMPSASPPMSMPPEVITVTLGPGSPSSPPASPSAFPPNSSTPAAGPPPPVTVVTSIEAPSASPPSPSSPEPSSPEPSVPGTAPPITLVTTLGFPNTTAPPSEPSSPAAPAPPITIVTTIGGPGGTEPPRVITIVTTPGYPNATLLPGGPAPSGPAASGPPPVVTVVVSAPGVSGAPGSLITIVTTVGAPGATPPAASGAPSAPGSPASAPPSFVTVVTSAGAPGSPANPSSPGNPDSSTVVTVVASAEPGNPPASGSPPGSAETSVVTPVPTGGSPPGSPLSSSPAGSSSEIRYSAVTIVETIGGSSGTPTSLVTIVSTIAVGGSGVPVPPGLPSSTAPAGSVSGGVSVSGIPTSLATSVVTAPNSGSLGSSVAGSGGAGSPTVSPGASGAPPNSPGSSVAAGSPTGSPVESGGALNSPGSSVAGGPSAGNPAGDPSTSGPGSLPTNGPAGSESAGPGSGTSTESDPRASSANSNPSSADSSSDLPPTTLPTNPHAPTSLSGSILPGYPPGVSVSSFFPPRNATASTNLPTVVLPTTLATLTPSPTSPTCDAYVGIEIIYFIEITEVCPEGATITTTITSCTSTATRPICATSTPGYPCYPCIIGTPSSGDTATVTRSSCTSLTTSTATITGQLCNTCETVTYTTSIPGYTPGGPCKGCQPYSSGSLTLPLPPTTIINTIAATSTVVIPLEGNCPGSGCPASYPVGGGPGPVVPGTPTDNPVPGTTVVPGNPGLPTDAPGYGATTTHPAVVSSVPYKPSTVPTAGGSSRRVVWELMAGIVGAVGYALLML